MTARATPNAVRTVATASGASIRAGVERAAYDRRADETATYLTSLDDDTFLRLVEEEARGHLPAEVADVFGHPRVCDRWNQAIKTLQMRAAGTKGVAPYLAALAERRASAVHAIRWANDQSHNRRLTVGAPATPRNRAIDRLIVAHAEEFERYVNEELAP